MKAVLEQLNSRLDETDVSDYFLDGLKDERLVILGSYDLSYYHDVEIVFEEVRYICCPIRLDSPRFRPADEAERRIALEKAGENADPDGDIHVISIDEEGSRKGQHFIIASDVSFRFEKVLHYVNDDVMGE